MYGNILRCKKVEPVLGRPIWKKICGWPCCGIGQFVFVYRRIVQRFGCAQGFKKGLNFEDENEFYFLQVFGESSPRCLRKISGS